MHDVSSWRPVFPDGRLERIYLHWTAADYEAVFPAYHYCVTYGTDGVRIVATHPLDHNMRDVRQGDLPYAAHTLGRNSFAAGLAVAGMAGASPSDFGLYPLRRDALDGLCTVAAAIAKRYAIPVDALHVMTHAEAAVADGYFGVAKDERWDIARLAPSPEQLAPLEAYDTGEQLRTWIRSAGVTLD